MDFRYSQKIILSIALMEIFSNQFSYAEMAVNPDLPYKSSWNASSHERRLSSSLTYLIDQNESILQQMSPGGTMLRLRGNSVLVRFNGYSIRLDNSFFQFSPVGYIYSNYEQNQQALYLTASSLAPPIDDKPASDPCYLIRIGLNGVVSSFHLNPIPYPEKSSKMVDPNAASGFIVEPEYIKQNLSKAKKCETKPFSLQKNDIVVSGTFSTNDSDHMKKAKVIYGDDPFIGDDKGIVYNSLFVTWRKENRTIEIPFDVFAGVHDTFESCENPGGFVLETPDEDTVIISNLLHSYVYDPIRFVIVINKKYNFVESTFLGLSEWNTIKIDRGGREKQRETYENNSYWLFKEMRENKIRDNPDKKKRK